MLLYRLRRSKNRGHVFEIYIVMRNDHQGPEAQTMDWRTKLITARSDGELTLKMMKSVLYGETMRPDFRDRIEVKIVGATYSPTNARMMAIVARMTM